MIPSLIVLGIGFLLARTLSTQPSNWMAPIGTALLDQLAAGAATPSLIGRAPSQANIQAALLRRSTSVLTDSPKKNDRSTRAFAAPQGAIEVVPRRSDSLKILAVAPDIHRGERRLAGEAGGAALGRGPAVHGAV